MEKARLDKIIAGEGTYSRREVRLLVRQGRVLVNGVPARSPEDKVVPEAVEIMVDGTVLHCRTIPMTDMVYMAMKFEKRS